MFKMELHKFSPNGHVEKSGQVDMDTRGIPDKLLPGFG